MPQYQLNKNTLRLFIRAYCFWSNLDFMGGPTREQKDYEELFNRLSKLFKKRWGWSCYPTEDGVKSKFEKENPSKAAYALFPGRFDARHKRKTMKFREWLMNHNLHLDHYFTARILPEVNYEKEYQKLCKWFQKNTTDDERKYLMESDDPYWDENVSEDVQYLFVFLSDRLK